MTTDAASGVTWTASNGSQYNVATLIVQSNQSSIFATVTVNGCTSLPSQTISTTVLPIQTPSFSQIPAICSGDNLTIPTTSNNGISGTWSPQISNTQSKTYTFTANAGQCANTQTMSITVNSLPQVSLATFNNLCDTIALFQLSGGSPIGGTYTGTSVSNNKFSTSVGVGSYPITYTYTNSNGCKSSALKNLNVINCNTSNIEEIVELNYKIYPNPTTESITIESSIELINTDYILFDISGRSLMSGTLIDAKTEINLSKLSSGTYYIKIFNNNVKLVKQ